MAQRRPFVTVAFAQGIDGSLAAEPGRPLPSILATYDRSDRIVVARATDFPGTRPLAAAVDTAWDLDALPVHYRQVLHRVGAVIARWTATVGPEVAQHVAPRTFEDGVLTIENPALPWAAAIAGFLPGDPWERRADGPLEVDIAGRAGTTTLVYGFGLTAGAAREAAVRARQLVEVLDRQRARRQELAAQQAGLREERAVYDELRAACGRNGVPAMIIEAVIPEIETSANDLPRKLTAGQINARFETPRQKKSR